MVEGLDEKYFDITDQNDGLDAAGMALCWFRKARAVNAVMYAVGCESLQSFCDVLYEAHAATNDLKTIEAICRNT